MNDILSITVDSNIEHGMRVKNCAESCTKMRRNKQTL